MTCKMKNIRPVVTFKVTPFILLFAMLVLAQHVLAQETKTATIQLTFLQTDSTKICKATVLSADSSLPVKEKEIHLYVKRMYGILPVGKVVATDESGEAAIDFPMDLPGDQNNMIAVIARIEKDETYGDVETTSTVKWGVPKTESYHSGSRSLSASREHAPMFLVIASSLIILVIWGTIFYVVFQLVRIKKSGSTAKVNPAAVS